jgi:hypothetical protein
MCVYVRACVCVRVAAHAHLRYLRWAAFASIVENRSNLEGVEDHKRRDPENTHNCGDVLFVQQEAFVSSLELTQEVTQAHLLPIHTADTEAVGAARGADVNGRCFC